MTMHPLIIASPWGWLALAALLGASARRLTRLLAEDSILAAARTRFYARFPPPPEAHGPDFRTFRWFPDSVFRGWDKAELPPVRGRLHGRRGYWVVTLPPVPEPTEDGGFALPLVSWDETHEGASLDRQHYPLRPVSWWGKLLVCPWCLSVWLVGLTTAVALIVSVWAILGLVMLTAMELAALLALVEHKLGS